MSDINQNPDDGAAAGEPNSQAGQESDFTASIETDLRKLQEERDALFEQLARITADFQNARRRLEGEKQQAIQYANTQLIKNLLPVIDNFERALEVDPAKTDVPALLKGMQIVHDQLLKVLAAQHVEPIAPAPGTPFDPNHHEALMQQADERFPEPAVVQLLQKGYAMQGRTLRPAQVVVSRGRE